jgi:flagellar hook-associated protein 1 FlgK
MGLTQALSTALSGLTATQTSLSLVAGNVANAQTPGYVRKTATLVESASGTTASSVQVAAINRELDQFVQSQLRTESAGAAYADLRANMYNELQGLYGTPGSTSTLESAFNNFTSSLQALTTSPDDRPTQTAVVNAAQQLTQQLNSLSDGIQSLRSQAELGLSDDVTQANSALQEIAQINQQLAASPQQDSTTAALEDQRDRDIDQLSKLMDVQVLRSNNNQVSIMTTSGVQLVSGGQASTLSFDARGTMSAQAQWSANPAQRGVGTITLTAPNGSTTDLVASNAIRSGEIAGYLEMRDQTLVQAQDQLDQFAAAISSALSGQPTAGTAVSAGAQNGFAVDIGSLSTGDSVSVTYTDTASGQQHKLTVSGLDFSGGISSVVLQINAALAGTGMTASNPSGTTLEILDDGAANTVDVNSLTATAQTTSLTGDVALPLFVDGTSPYTGATTGGVPQSLGFAERIAVNQSLIDDPTLLVNYQAGTAAADPTRPNFIYDQMVNAALDYSPSAGIGTAAAPFSGTAGTYLSQIVGLQAAAASNAANLKQGQDVVLSSLQQRFNQTAGVNIDQEMSDLLNLQNSYAANARVMNTVNAMLTALMQMGV